MNKQNKKKMGYKQYEQLLVLAHKKSEVLAQRLQALQSYIVSYIEYNDGAPSSEEVIKFMNDFGFSEKMSIGEHYNGDKIVQKDVVFVNNNS